MSNGSFWTNTQWAIFNDTPASQAGTTPAVPAKLGLLHTTMTPIAVAQQVFLNTIVTGTDNPIPADRIDRGTGIPTTGETRGVATLRKPFKLFPVHVSDPLLTMASNQVTLAGQALALVEDMLFFQGKNAPLPKPEGQAVYLDAGDKEKLGEGLLGIAASNKTIIVRQREKGIWGLATYKAVVEGIGQFTNDLQGPSYSLIVSPKLFADANLPLPGNVLVTPSSAIQSLLSNGQFVPSPGMPNEFGLLASLGGQTTTLYIGTGPLVEYNAYDNSVYSFTARESIQFLNIDSRSLIRLQFEEKVEA